MSRLVAGVVAWGAVCMGCVCIGCGGDDPEEPPTPPDDGSESEPLPDEPSDPEELAFAITGRTAPMTARAELKINEGERPVHVAITGRTSGTDFVMIDLTFDGLDDAIGPHHVEFSLPAGGEYVVISSLDDTAYYSQGGEIDLSVSADGSIEGRFDIDLAPGTLAVPGEGPAVSTRSDVTTELAGAFNGGWVLNCHSRLMGHTSFTVGGDYCDALVIEE